MFRLKMIELRDDRARRAEWIDVLGRKIIFGCHRIFERERRIMWCWTTGHRSSGDKVDCLGRSADKAQAKEPYDLIRKAEGPIAVSQLSRSQE